MLVKFFARGVGKGSGPVEYITRLDNPNTGTRREPAPEVIRGNPEITKQLIDGLDFKYKYNSGVLSFAIEDAPTEKEQQALIDSFEAYAFAGINTDAYNTLWVRHTHTGNDRVELHFVTPKVELDTGKSLNIAPPGWHGYFKPWQSLWNIKQDWARPDDPARKRIYSRGYIALIDAESQRAGQEAAPDPKKQLTEYITKRIEAGLVTNRDHIINSFAELGLEIPRQGKNYITVKNPEDNQRYRLKGGIYEASWRLGGQPEKENRSGEQTLRGNGRTRTPGTKTTTESTKKSDLNRIQERIRELAQARASYHISRYGGSQPNLQKILGPTMDVAIGHSRESLSGYLRRELGSDRIPINSDDPETSPTRLSQPGDRTTTADLEPSQEPNQGDKSIRNQQRNIYHPAPIQTTNPRLEVPGTTLSKNGVTNERTRKPTEVVISTVSQAVQRTNRNSIQQILTGYEAVVGAEQAATASGQRLERTSNELEAANQQLNQLHRQVHASLERGRRALKRKRKEELEKFQTEINLVEYAQSQGYQYITSESSRNSAVLAHQNGDKIVVATDTDGHGVYFSVRDDADNGTIIDFVQNRRNLSLTEVRKELRSWLNQDSRAVLGDVAPPKPVNRERISLIKEFSGFSAPMNHPYLAERGIAFSTINSKRFTNRIATDSKENVIFPHYDRDGLTGYSIKNFNFTSFSGEGTRALWQSNPHEDDTRLVITARAIDALSYHQLFPHPHTRYISTEGRPSNYQRELILEAMAELNNAGDEIILATDNDEAGNQLAHNLASLASHATQVKRHAPLSGKGWNEFLLRQKHLNQSSSQQPKPKPKQKKPNQLEL